MDGAMCSERQVDIQPAEPFPIQLRSTKPEHIQEQASQQQQLQAEEIDVSIVGGRLKFFIKEWQRITSDKFILQTVKGYKIPFLKPVSQFRVPNVKFESLLEEQRCAEAIEVLLAKSAIRPCHYEPGQFLSSYFTIPKPDGSYRFIFNLHNLNSFIKCEHFKMEDVRTARRLITQNCFMATIDLADAFLLIPIDPEFTKYLRFSFRGILYEFVVVSFGLCTAPFVFTKLMKPPISILRKRGYTSVIYIDDKLVIEDSYERCLENIEESRKLLKKLGFLFNNKKCNLVPSHICKYLGFILNSKSLVIELQRKRNQS